MSLGDRLYKKGLFSDVTLIVGDTKIKAHKVIWAARSPVFEKMFTSDILGKPSQEVVIQDIPKDFDLFVKFLYSSYIGADHSALTMELMLFAKKYMVDEFFQYCMYDFILLLDTENAMRCFLAAVICKDEAIIKQVIKFIKHNKHSVQKSKDYDIVLNQEDVAHSMCLNLLSDDKKVVKRTSWRPDLFLDAENYYNSDKFSDITIKIGNTEIKAHKAILAASSETFADLLETKYPNKENNELLIDDIDETNFCLFLKFVYSQKLDEDQINSKIFNIAFKYKVKSLAQICQMKMVDELSVDNVCEYLSMSHTLDCFFLEFSAKMFIKKQLDTNPNCKVIPNKTDFLKTAVDVLLRTSSSYRNCEYNVISLNGTKLLGTFEGSECRVNESFVAHKNQKWLLGVISYEENEKDVEQIPSYQVNEQVLKHCFFIKKVRNANTDDVQN